MRNIVAAGGGEVARKWRRLEITNPRVFTAETDEDLPFAAASMSRRMGYWCATSVVSRPPCAGRWVRQGLSSPSVRNLPGGGPFYSPMRTHTLLLTIAALAVPPATDAVAKKTSGMRPAGPDRVASVLRDCTRDGDLDRRYRVTTLRRTLRHMPSDIAQYTDCVRVIRRDIRRRG
ncbi:hypothetical protein LRS13_17710 [Svornostia abyssi]|uniref:Uncharacterized protein n=1 Tax=Svornostia abyssi TaxID=2898438 RepID=A0ABY5PCY1_9ACTN|nr:hypothetical protein LRS13_17710 [Parviterribacteraceae bacterium J379]